MSDKKMSKSEVLRNRIIFLAVILIVVVIIVVSCNRRTKNVGENPGTNTPNVSNTGTSAGANTETVSFSDKLARYTTPNSIDGDKTRELVSLIIDENAQLSDDKKIAVELKTFRGNVSLTSSQDGLNKIYSGIGSYFSEYTITVTDQYDDGSVKSILINQKVGTNDDPLIEEDDIQIDPMMGFFPENLESAE